MKFIHTADIHLDSPLKGLEQYDGAPVEEIRGATRRSLERLVDLAMEEEVDFLLIAGDLYDGDWRDHNTGLFFVKEMTRLRESGIPVFIVRGNHDAENKMTRTLRLPEQVTVFQSLPHSKMLPGLDVAIHGCSFSEPAVTENLAAQFPPGKPGVFNVGLLHTSLDGREGHARYAPCSIDDLKSKNYQYWALGHVHTREVQTKFDPPIVFPGNLQGRHIRESGPKGCELVHVSEQGAVTLEFRPLDVLRWMHARIDCGGAEDADEVLKLCHQYFQQLKQESDGLPLAVRVMLHGATRAHQRMLASPVDWINQVRAVAIDAGGGRIWIEKVLVRTSPRGALVELGIADGPLGELTAYLRELKDDPQQLFQLAEQLTPLMRKLPAELSVGPEPLLLDDPSALAELLAEVEPLLVSRLQEAEDS